MYIDIRCSPDLMTISSESIMMKTEEIKIDNESITFFDNDIILIHNIHIHNDGKHYNEKEGLWGLLTKKG